MEPTMAREFAKKIFIKQGGERMSENSVPTTIWLK
jgi:hypothetical protein